MDTRIDIPSDALVAFADDQSDAPELAVRFLKSIAHRDRLKILCGLLGDEKSVSDIEAQVGASQSAVSQHLARLKSDGILAARRDGRQIYYSISDPMVRNLIALLYLRFCAAE